MYDNHNTFDEPIQDSWICEKGNVFEYNEAILLQRRSHVEMCGDERAEKLRKTQRCQRENG